MCAGEVEAAAAQFRKAIDIAPKFVLAHYNLGRALAVKKDADGAIAAFRKAIDLDPRYGPAHFFLGKVLYVLKKDVEGAIAEYRKAIQLPPQLPRAKSSRKNTSLPPGCTSRHSSLGLRC